MRVLGDVLAEVLANTARRVAERKAGRICALGSAAPEEGKGAGEEGHSSTHSAEAQTAMPKLKEASTATSTVRLLAGATGSKGSTSGGRYGARRSII